MKGISCKTEAETVRLVDSLRAMPKRANSKSHVKALFVSCVLAFGILAHAGKPPEVPKVGLIVATFCDSATDDNGKLSIQGTFNTIFATQFTAILPRCAFAVRLAFRKEEYKKHVVKVRFLDSNGKSFFDDVEIPLEVNEWEPGAAVTTKNVIVNITKMQFPRQGTYYVQLLLDDKALTTSHLFVHPPTKKQ